MQTNSAIVIQAPRAAVLSAIEHAYHYSTAYQRKLDQLITNTDKKLSTILEELPDETIVKALELMS